MACRLEPYIGLLAEVRWRNHNELEYANLQAIVVLDGDLEDLYLDEQGEVPAQYLRLDFDLRNIGLLFREPQPHIHVHPNGEPRLAISGAKNAVVAFLDFLYRNYCYTKWEDWVRDVWEKHAAEPDRDLLLKIMCAFRDSQAEYLHEHHAGHIARLKKYLSQEAQDAYPVRVPAQWLGLLDLAL